MTTLALWLLARGLVLTAREIVGRIRASERITAEGWVNVHTGEWSEAPQTSPDRTLYLGGLSTRAITVTRLARCGHVVLAREWTPDGGPVVYVLLAREERTYEPDANPCDVCGRMP